MEAIWEQWDLVCDPSGCDPLDQLLRAMVYGFLVIALTVFYAAVRPWTTNLPRPAGIAVSAVASLIIVWMARAYVVGSGSLRAAAVIAVVGLLAVWIGRPAFTERSRSDPDESLSGDATPTSSTR